MVVVLVCWLIMKKAVIHLVINKTEEVITLIFGLSSCEKHLIQLILLSLTSCYIVIIWLVHHVVMWLFEHLQKNLLPLSSAKY